MFKRSEEEFTALKRETSEICEKFVCLSDEDIQSLMTHVNSFKNLGATALNNKLVPAKQSEHSKRIFYEFFDLLNQDKLDMRILKSACVPTSAS